MLFDPWAKFLFSRGAGIVYLFTTSLHATVLGVLMALAPTVWYPIYAGRTEIWGLTALEDQQLAGLIMWMPACAAYAVAGVLLLVRWLEESETGIRPRRSPARKVISACDVT